ncbi:DUF3987 domain-containing protein [Spirosoma sp. HMF4905]|uniref:DUF3987 domain-containing protein n=1 Tax=Spirosoma arboris TaxID=2682092 RepID=A0A7K1S3Q0_9BACT|nr:YfjI family protein [Spirosoma arboris]MVM28447.1 DUF3987 domain-containing protein [Spirosoma arboris]
MPKWLTPEPIKTNLLAVLPLDPEMIPTTLRPWLTDIAYRMKCPLDFVAATCIAMLSSLIGTRLTIKPKFHDDWTVVPNLWGAVIGDPSTMKTPSMSEVCKPVNRIAIESHNEFLLEMQRYEAEQATTDAQKKVFLSQEQDRLKGKKVEHPVSYPEIPQKPTERRYLINDATVEKIADLLNENPAGLLQLRDELIGLLAGWDKSGREQDRAFFLEAWNGIGSMTIDRIGRGTTHVNNVCLSLFGGIQPGKLLGYLRDATGYENDGFVQRLQLAVYPDKTPWSYVDEYPDKQARDNAFKLIRRIAESSFLSISYEADEYNRFAYTRFEPAAQQVFKDWLIEWETQILQNETGLLLEHFTKYRSLMPSLALIFHVVNCEADSSEVQGTQKQLVSIDAARMAVKWCEYLQSHARRIYGLLDSVSEVAAKDLLRHLKAGALKDGFKVREVRQKGWTGLTSADAVDSALSELISRNWLKEVIPPAPVTGRPEAPHYLIHPQLISQNA